MNDAYAVIYLSISTAVLLLVSLFIFLIYFFFFKKPKGLDQKSDFDLRYENIQLEKALKASAIFALVSLAAIITARLTDIWAFYFVTGIHILVLVTWMFINDIQNNTRFIAAAFFLSIFNIIIQSTELVNILQIGTNSDILEIAFYGLRALQEGLQSIYAMQFLYPLPFILILLSFIKSTHSVQRKKVLKVLLIISVAQRIVSEAVYATLLSNSDNLFVHAIYEALTLMIDYGVFLYFVISSLKEMRQIEKAK